MTNLVADGGYIIETGGARNGQPWTEAQDRILLTRGPAYGYGAVAERELGRTAVAGYKRHQKLTKE